MFYKQFLAIIATSSVAVGAAMAQSFSSFQDATFYGITVTTNGLMDSVTLSDDPYLIQTNGDVEHPIGYIFGFWSLGATDTLDDAGSDQGGWKYVDKSDNSGDIAGWDDNNKKVDIQPGGQMSFTYEAIDQGNVQEFGFHTSDGYYKGPLSQTPEPVMVWFFSAGVFALVRRRLKIVEINRA